MTAQEEWNEIKGEIELAITKTFVHKWTYWSKSIDVVILGSRENPKIIIILTP